jgi:glycoside/pentoside/hexuronide:cation symporter, GPH family
MIAARERASFAAGDLGFNFIWQSIELYLLFFYIEILGLSPASASAIFLAGALTDWLADPLIGMLIDRAAPRMTMRGWVVIGGPAASAALILAFAEPALPGNWLLGYALAAHLALRVCYSLGNIPYGALTSRISGAPEDHVALTAARMQGAAIGGIIAALVYAVMPTRGGHGDADFAMGAVMLAVLALPAFLTTFFGVRERVEARGAAVGRPMEQFGAMARLTVQSAALRRLLVTILAAGLSVTVMNKSILFLFAHLDAIRLGYIAAIIPPLSLLLTVPLWLRVAQHLGRVTALIIGALLNVTAALALPFAGNNVLAVGLIVTVALVAGNGMSVMFWALIPDVVDAVEIDHAGEACAARIYALAGISRKLAQALAPQFVSLGLLISRGESVVPGIVAVGVLTVVVIISYRPREVAGPYVAS